MALRFPVPNGWVYRFVKFSSGQDSVVFVPDYRNAPTMDPGRYTQGEPQGRPMQSMSHWGMLEDDYR